MYLADLLNTHGLFQRTSSWMQADGFSDAISVLLGRATSAVDSILRIEQAGIHCVREYDLFKDQLEGLEEKIVFNSRSMVEIQNEISPLLSTLRIIQDTVISLIGKHLGKSLPSSISDVVKKIEKYDLPVELKNLLLEYWAKDGSLIRDYRVLDQHFSSISDHVFLQLKPENKVLLLFPDNPKVKSKSRFTYNDEICGISLLRIGFDNLHELIESIAEYFGYHQGRLNSSIKLSQLGDLTPFRKRLLSFVFESTISTKEDGQSSLNISGYRVSQKEDGRIELQRMLLSDEKLRKLKG